MRSRFSASHFYILVCNVVLAQSFDDALGVGKEAGSSLFLGNGRVGAEIVIDQRHAHRIGFGENGMSTVFARALCDAAGWNMDRSAPSALNADVDYNRAITLDELGAYLSKRVMWYLNIAGSYTQSVSVYPQNDPGIVFERAGE